MKSLGRNERRQPPPSPFSSPLPVDNEYANQQSFLAGKNSTCVPCAQRNQHSCLCQPCPERIHIPNTQARGNRQKMIPLIHKVHICIYLEYHSVCPLVRIGTTPPPLPQARVSPPPLPEPQGGGHTRLRVRKWGGLSSYY
jgi:hypothetical protein